MRRLRVLTWHVHGNYLHYLSHAEHDFAIATLPGHPPGHAGRVGALPWRPNVREVDADALARERFDLVLYQHRDHWQRDRMERLSAEQRRLPAVVLEHDPPQAHPTDTRHPAADEATLIVHVTPFNALMWDHGLAGVAVVEHGVAVPPDLRWRGDDSAGLVVINHLARRGRRLGADLFERARREVPLVLVGMDSERSGGDGEVGNTALPALMARHRYFFHPVRWTSLGLALVEAMHVGMPVVALAATEVPSIIRNGVNGFADTRLETLIDTMQRLRHDHALAAQWGQAARATARERFGIGRFADEWTRLLWRAAN